MKQNENFFFLFIFEICLWVQRDCQKGQSVQTNSGLSFWDQKTMGLLLSHTHLHGENNSPQSGFYLIAFKKFGSLLAQQSPSNLFSLVNTLPPMRTTTSMRFDLKFFGIFSNYSHWPESFITFLFQQKISTVIFIKGA